MAQASLDVAQLRTFVAIDDEGGFGRAAEALHLSQPTVSQHVRALEQRLGATLLERDGRRRRFTTAGERVLVEARRILAVHDEALARIGEPRLPRLRVGVAETVAEWLPQLLRALRVAFPERAGFVVERSTSITEAVTAGELDLAVVLDAGGTLGGALLASIPLRWFSATTPGSGPVPLVAYLEPCGIRRRAFAVLGDAGRSVEVVAESSTFEGLLAAARAGLGVAPLPWRGGAPLGLRVQDDLPPLGEVEVKLLSARGLAADSVTAALGALRRVIAAADSAATQLVEGDRP